MLEDERTDPRGPEGVILFLRAPNLLAARRVLRLDGGATPLLAMPTHYERLHVTENAPAEVIRAAYRALSLKHHPDTAGDQRPHSRQRMQAINDAYAVLCDAEKRRAYDVLLLNERRPGVTPAQPAASFTRVKRQRHRSEPMPDWLVRTFLLLSDARIAVPLVALIWIVILALAYRK